MKNSLKILFVSQYFYPEQFSNNSIAQYLAQQGHAIKVVTSVPNYPQGEFFEGYSNQKNREEQWNDVSIHRAWTSPRGKTSFSLIRNFLTFPLTGSFLANRLAAGSDITFISMPSPLFQAFIGVFVRWRKKIPTVYWVQDLWPETVIYTLGLKNRLVCKALDGICGWLYRRADLILVQSEAFIPSIEKFGVELERIRLYPNSATQSYVPLPRRGHPLIKQDESRSRFRLMFAGNIGESQDFDTIIECADKLRDRAELEWIIVGSGRDQSRVEAEIAKRGLQNQFTFLGRHPESDMPDLFAQADAMLVTLKSNPVFALTVPYKVQCYMACGKPIIAALDGEGVRIITEANAGKSVPASRPEKLADVIVEFLEMDHETRDQFGNSARAYYEQHYEADIINARLVAWLNETANA